MLKRLLVLVAGIAGLSAVALADDSFTVGHVSFSVPEGWKQLDSTDDRQTFATPDGRQRATISTMHLDKAPSFAEFQLLCAHRYDAEREGVKDLVLIPRDPNPRNADGAMTMTFSGEENPRSRVFSGFLWVKGQELVTLYVEGVGITADRNADAFQVIFKSLR